MKSRFWSLSLLCVLSAAHAENGYLCVAEQGVGFTFDNKKKSWRPAHFDIKKNKYTLSQKSGKWTWVQLGDVREYPCSEFSLSDTIQCGYRGVSDYLFSKKTMRFQYIYAVGYLVDEDSNDNTPAMMIGTCSAF